MGKNRDAVHLERLRDYYARHAVLPSYAGMGDLLGIRSKGGVAKLVTRLRERGYLNMPVAGRLAPTAKFFARFLVEYAPAGFPSPATESLGGVISIDDYLVEHPSQTVLVEIKGDSMIGAGIHAGDIVIVERNPQPQPGSIVVAMVDGEYTVKYLERDQQGYCLRPANPHYALIRSEGELQIFGVVVGQFRKY